MMILHWPFGPVELLWINLNLLFPIMDRNMILAPSINDPCLPTGLVSVCLCLSLSITILISTGDISAEELFNMFFGGGFSSGSNVYRHHRTPHRHHNRSSAEEVSDILQIPQLLWHMKIFAVSDDFIKWVVSVRPSVIISIQTNRPHFFDFRIATYKWGRRSKVRIVIAPLLLNTNIKFYY